MFPVLILGETVCYTHTPTVSVLANVDDDDTLASVSLNSSSKRKYWSTSLTVSIPLNTDLVELSM